MPRKPRPEIGTCPCPQCSADSPVRKARDGTLYGCCPKCSTFKGQDWILEKATIWGENAPPTPVPTSVPAPAPVPGTGVAPIELPKRTPANDEPAGEPTEEQEPDDDAPGIRWPWEA